MSGEETLNLKNVRPDGIETIEGGLENYLAEQETVDKEAEENPILEFTLEEKLKLLRQYRKSTEEYPESVSVEDAENLTEEELEQLRDFAKLRERKQVYGFVYRKKVVTDDDVKDLTEDEVKELTAKAIVMSQHLTYDSKKTYDTKYKKKRQRKNKMAKASRRRNR